MEKLLIYPTFAYQLQNENVFFLFIIAKLRIYVRMHMYFIMKMFYFYLIVDNAK